MNTVCLMGRLTRDPEVRYTGSGTAVASFSLAVDRAGDRNDDGSYESGFFDCEAWDKTAELIEQYIGKGRLIGVEGRLKHHRWEKDGNKRSRVEIVVSRITFGGDRSTSEDADGQQHLGTQPDPTPTNPPDDADSDIPF